MSASGSESTSSTISSESTQPHEFLLIDGQKISDEIKEEVSQSIKQIVEKQLKEGKSEDEVKRPGLAVILVGQRKDSQTYVSMKKKTCISLGMRSFETTFEDGENTTEEQIIEAIQKYNEDERVHGILIQLPLPAHINEERVLSSVKLEKDVDGLSVYNIGRLAMRGRDPTFIPCTPAGCLELIKRTAKTLNKNLDGANAIVIGRSNIVGIPMSLLLLHKLNCTVQIVHSKSKDIPEKVKQADIVVACCGQREFVQPEWIKEGSIVIDVGINAVEDSTKKAGYRLVGDVKFDETLQKRAAAATPVPRGVGPMTICMLMSNTFTGFKRKHPELFE
ncbi:hypothetical protein FDP41_013283 [Naegleria fowleri]|uniref:Uncharacterized protein n=1 Tax=Naegleria fowleri TaxID=5763 RepID=A0A6A5C4K2_NAEFO|nr:uncharacterized protein FDP41_013283 [Naegleria fowleri]KAF0980800.1 hypothetical protein FDP41_013283 [Naegleria fowleri]